MMNELYSDGYGAQPPVFRFAVRDGLDENYLPMRSDSSATGWDVRAAHDVILTPFQHATIHLGIRCFAPTGWWLELRPRSSTFAKKHLASLYGVIDEGYEGEIMFACQWTPYHDEALSFKIEKGDRIGQLVPVRRQEMIIQGITNEAFDILCKERGLERGAGGFGSTGK